MDQGADLLKKGPGATGADWYERNAREAFALYESVPAEQVLAWLVPYLPRPGSALDVGAGSGRDAAWLAGLGWEVVAVEPADGLRMLASRQHSSPGIRWVRDALPGLPSVSGALAPVPEASARVEVAPRQRSFDLALVNAVWMHVALPERPRSFRTLMELVKPSGIVGFLLRSPADPGRGQHEATVEEIGELADESGATVVAHGNVPDFLGRKSVSWNWAVVSPGAVD